MRRTLLASFAAITAVLSLGLAPSPANAAPRVSCIWYNTTTGGGLNGRTMLAVCRLGNYVGEVRGKHRNLGDHSHTGYLEIKQGTKKRTSPTVEVLPGDDYDGPWWHINENWPSGHRVCAVWVKANGSKTSGYACWTK
ncbi:hypothetical protein [Couchioplanes caeruleus]|uniref:Secreted protein n=2 Tax=Couchioplanes caeruleus TaxID=56438 RepID=A0A1K0FRP0_9ACTN|nr:hypothetical protein [Couchioplanes caeruleus]OJF15509.1 hypothetical protein BG844_03980 [Couchioplanes caeruleus subsp. caeruleus]ROP30956.1 hypothetical protein EDD30_3841 [Couchioplanes caeruleus]